MADPNFNREGDAEQEALPSAQLPLTQQNVWSSEQLLGDKTEAFITHVGEIYRLRRTRQGKLILYK